MWESDLIFVSKNLKKNFIFQFFKFKIMAKMSLLNVLRSASDTNDSDLGPFTMDCRLRNNLDGYQFDNINQFNGRTAISFDFVPKFS